MPAIIVTLTETEWQHIRELVEDNLKTHELRSFPDPYGFNKVIAELDAGIVKKLEDAPEPKYLPILCKDCGKDHDSDMYIVHNELWAQAGLDHHDFCCKDCLSKRIGRPIVESDYTNCPLNWMCVPDFGTDERRADWARNFDEPVL